MIQFKTSRKHILETYSCYLSAPRSFFHLAADPEINHW